MHRPSHLMLLATVLLISACAGSAINDATTTAQVEGVQTAGPIKDDKEILSAQWMTRDFTEELTTATSGSSVGLLVKTRNYAPGEILEIVISNQLDGTGGISKTLRGTVDAQGEVRMITRTD
ncbi:hypothetical protein SAMN04487857_113164 [Pseudomonas sp. ok272]|uniref:hypothetical protein n=1 Tax=unclassified Pseudomonas TaxID=196821 RepID=UPI0008C8C9B7|nr:MULTISPECIES: hypothetical protein [unclassified Pseudomonas]SEN32358.1 hypothetical protein SAMN04487857_113164 [Pseudomonas sp. ok272]SFN18596.1 hypothetical protein SAMN04487858_1146 [Pseudomonas sp. ok602]